MVLLTTPAVCRGPMTLIREGLLVLTDTGVEWEPYYRLGPLGGPTIRFDLTEIANVHLIKSTTFGDAVRVQLSDYRSYEFEARVSALDTFVAEALSALPFNWLLRSGNRSAELFGAIQASLRDSVERG
jgi:hypothetical protein